MKAYRPEIDGLRAIAVIAVILFHSGIGLFSGGFVGVDVFFVISGYLITSIIRAELQQGTFSFARFYERRARRILPALFLVSLASMPFAWQWLLPDQFSQYAGSLVSTNLYYSNFFFWVKSGYFDTSSELSPLLHTWSLSVEEQYYLVFPLLLFVLWIWRRQLTVPVLACAVLASFALAEYGAQTGSSGAYYLLPTRAWELGVGALLAMLPDWNARLASTARVALGAAGLTMIIGSAIMFQKATPFPGRYALVPTLGAAVVIAVTRSGDSIGRLLGSRPFVATGLISYSLYLWHQPVLAFARQRLFENPGGVALLGLLLLVAALSYLSWRFVERPFRDRSVSLAMLVALCGIATAFIVTTGLAIVSRNGIPGRFAFISASAEPERMQLARHDNGWCFYSVDTDQRLQIGAAGHGCVLGERTSSVRVLLFGDSFAGQYEPLWDALGKANGFSVTAVTTNWCSPSLDDSFIGPRSSRSLRQCMENRRYLQDHAGDFAAVILGGAWTSVVRDGYLAGSINLIKWLTSLGKPVLVMPGPPVYDSNVNYSFQLAQELHESYDLTKSLSNNDAATRQANATLADAVRGIAGAVFVDRDALFDRRYGNGHLTAEGKPYSLDGAHISVYGSRALARQLVDNGEGKVLVSALLTGDHALRVAPGVGSRQTID
jgi:peptidoglycan/LPS O-acetylase OafA/YrhL